MALYPAVDRLLLFRTFRREFAELTVSRPRKHHRFIVWERHQQRLRKYFTVAEVPIIRVNQYGCSPVSIPKSSPLTHDLLPHSPVVRHNPARGQFGLTPGGPL